MSPRGRCGGRKLTSGRSSLRRLTLGASSLLESAPDSRLDGLSDHDEYQSSCGLRSRSVLLSWYPCHLCDDLSSQEHHVFSGSVSVQSLCDHLSTTTFVFVRAHVLLGVGISFPVSARTKLFETWAKPVRCTTSAVERVSAGTALKRTPVAVSGIRAHDFGAAPTMTFSVLAHSLVRICSACFIASTKNRVSLVHNFDFLQVRTQITAFSFHCTSAT